MAELVGRHTLQHAGSTHFVGLFFSSQGVVAHRTFLSRSRPSATFIFQSDEFELHEVNFAKSEFDRIAVSTTSIVLSDCIARVTSAKSAKPLSVS